MENTAYEINKNKVISENLEGETIIINLENGNYYSMNETGSIVWGQIEEKIPLQNIAKFLEQNYTAELGTIFKEVESLATSLENDGLIQKTTQINDIIKENSTQTKKDFIAPKIDKYEDMQEMLLADPIHDVDAMGWPKLKEDN